MAAAEGRLNRAWAPAEAHCAVSLGAQSIPALPGESDMPNAGAEADGGPTQ